jgi:phosphoglycolate phosphatase-like HAD superfamily hydrolase
VSSTDSSLSAVLNRASAVLFDFDGPLCDVFAGEPSANVARSLEHLAGPAGTDDPLEVLRLAAQRPGVDVREVDDQLIAAEVGAIASSIANENGLRALTLCLKSGRAVGIVSNNSERAIRAFIADHELDETSVLIVGRPYGRPDLMKPNPWAINRALITLRTPAERSVFIGDSLSDIEAARAARTSCVALANKPGKRAGFQATRAVVIDEMSDITAALSTY